MKTKEKKIVKKTTKVTAKPAGLSVPVYSLAGRETGTMELPKELFGERVNQALLAQALRVYLSNLKAHFASTKTRGEVRGSTRKIYRQKGTGRARHGARYAPIFVGGGIALGPKFRKVILTLPKKMKRAALISALSVKMAEKEVMGVENLKKATGKTAQIQKFLQSLGKKSALVVADGQTEKIMLAIKNLPHIALSTASEINALSVIKYQTLLLSKEGLGKLQLRLIGKEEK